MEARPIFIKLLLIAFVLTAVFGLYAAVLSPMHHEMGCPFSPGSVAMCDAALLHLSHWQSAFSAILAEVLVLVAFVAVLFTRTEVIPNILGPTGWRVLVRAPSRPTLLQELFSSGILNRKEPQIV